MEKVLGRDIITILRQTQGKKAILFGTDSLSDDVARKLECLGIEVAYRVEDGGENSLGRVRSYFSLLLEENFFVVIGARHVEHCAACLENIGLHFLRDYNTLAGAADFIKPDIAFSFDPHVGYSLPYQLTNGTGIRTFGDWENGKLKIAILGNSTSDPCCFPWKSWGEQLYEKLLSRGIKGAIIAAGTIAYASFEELLKLIRDILPKKPDLIISYSGINDRKTRYYPSVNYFQTSVFNKLGKEDSFSFLSRSVSQYSPGTGGIYSCAENWLKNQRMMHAVSAEFGVEFRAFLQPNLATKKKGCQDQEIYEYIDRDIIKALIEFEREVRIRLEGMDYIVDATAWMDDIDGVFLDYCHLDEDGSGALAEKMLHYIMEMYPDLGIFID